ncbi:MAG: pyridine nucleotide-disulfide oxidoreductase [Melioribacteraceae bacterium]|nr:MAG: pyridine nucleotide-disulfide oxidoreductase [Melioribacteraceae bacterium]
MYDLIIVGAGPIGLACAIEAKRQNLNYIVLEKGTLVDSIFNYPLNMVFFSTSERLEIGDVPFISHGMKPTRTEALEYYRRVKTSHSLEVNLYKEVTSVEKQDGAFNVFTSKNEYKAKNVVIATGFFMYPNLMGVPGEELPKVFHYYKEPHPFNEQKILVVGGGNSGVDVALETYRRGAEVTMVIRSDKIDDGVKYWVRPDIENRINEGSITAYFNSEVLEITPDTVIVQTPEGIVTIENDFVLAMTGYKPDYNLLEKSGIALTGGEKKIPHHDENTFETNISGLYLAGVVCGGMDTGKWFIENSRYHAKNIVGNIKSKTRK